MIQTIRLAARYRMRTIKRYLTVQYNRVFRREELVKLKEAHYANGKLNASFEVDPSVKLIVQSMIDLWNMAGGTNFVRWSVNDPETLIRYELILGREDRHSAAEISICFLDALRRIEAHPEDAAAISTTALKQMGYHHD